MRTHRIACVALLAVALTSDTSMGRGLILGNSNFRTSANCTTEACSVLFDRLARPQTLQTEDAEKSARPLVELGDINLVPHPHHFRADRRLRRAPRHSNFKARSDSEPNELRTLFQLGARRSRQLEQVQSGLPLDDDGKVPIEAAGKDFTRRTVLPFNAQKSTSMEMSRQPKPISGE